MASITRPASAAPGATPATRAVSTIAMPSFRREGGTDCWTMEMAATMVGAIAKPADEAGRRPSARSSRSG